MTGTHAGQQHLIASLRTVLTGTLFAVIAAGCGSSVVLDPPTIPEPLMNTIPISIGLRMPENFESFVHQEEVLGREQWTIDLGRSNAIFFEQLFNYMFENVTRVSETDDPSLMPFDALIEASIDEFEFSVPNQTKTDAFAVWIRYRIKIYDREGSLVVNWPVSAYGKSLTTTMGGSDALQRAAILAMRDAAALMIIKLDEPMLIASLTGTPDSTAAPAESNGEATANAVVPGGGSDD